MAGAVCVCFTILMLLVNCFTSGGEYEIWGVWNLGPEEFADIPFDNSLRTWDFLYFSNENKNEPIIGYEGGHYKIKKIISRNSNVISFFVEHKQTIQDERGALVTGTVFGKIIMHFIDKDHMWLELDYNDKKYPTHGQFSEGDFEGPDVIYWRAPKYEKENNIQLIEEKKPISETIEIEDIKEYLIDYFPDGNFQLLEQSLDVNFRRIDFAVHYINDDLSICNTIVGFEIIDGLFQRYLLINDFCFINIDDSILFDFSKEYTGIYGFAVSYSYPKVAGYTPGLYIDTCFDNGNRVADGITIMWNEDSKRFEKSIW
jgi:hypothetical protein